MPRKPACVGVEWDVENAGPRIGSTELNLLQVRHTALAQFHGPR